MLCSVPTPKSGSNWLDRLRSSKGFPVADNFDLDHFLTNHHDSLSNSPSPIPSNSNSAFIQSDNKLLSADRSQAVETSSANGDKEWFGVMTNVLCDLFNMGESHDKISRFSGKKSARKQIKPKFFDVSMPCAADDDESTRKDEYVSDKNSNVGTNADCGDDDADEEKEKSSGGNGSGSDKEELKGFSRSEVTVIDTSLDVWKLDKLVFRRKNIWKVVDKKGKSWTVGTKKRKGNHLDSSAIGNVGYKKKSKSTNSVFASSKDSHGGNFVLPVNDDQKQEGVCKNSSDVNFQVPKKRIHFCRSPRKLKKNCSSVLIKAIASSKKCRKNRHLKETHRE